MGDASLRDRDGFIDSDHMTNGSTKILLQPLVE